MIRLENVSKRFGEKRVLDQVTLEIRPGEILFVLGRSGTGKSVLLKHLVGLLRPDEGEIWVDDVEVGNLEEAELFELRRRVGMVFQLPALLDSLTIFENVAFGLKGRCSDYELEKQVKGAVEEVNLPQACLSQFPNELSIGMQKRVSLARTLVLKPEYLLFDEPTTGLDPVAITLVNEQIQKVARDLGAAAVVVSHDMQCALAIADRVVLLDQGKVVLDGDTEAFQKSELPLAQEFLREAKAHRGES